MLSKEPEALKLGPEDAPRTYWLKRPIPIERTNWRRAIATAGARFNGQVGLLDILAEGVKELMAESEAEIREAVLGKIEAHRQAVQVWAEAARAIPDSPTTDEQNALIELGKACADGATGLSVVHSEVLARYAPYAAAVGDDAVYWQLVGIEAARAFMVRWEGFDAALKRTRAGVDDGSLAEIPEGDFARIGMFAERLSRISERERKNSNTPPATPSGGETSTKSNGATSGTASNSASERRLVPRMN